MAMTMETARDGAPRAGPGAREDGERGDATVYEVADTPTSLAAIVAGAVLGVVSAVLLVALTAGPVAETVPSAWPLGVFVGGWIVSAWLLARETSRLLVVLRRGCLMGAAEWLALVALGRAAPLAQARTAGAVSHAAAVHQPSLQQVLSGSPATVMLWVCLAGWLLTWWSARRAA